MIQHTTAQFPQPNLRSARSVLSALTRRLTTFSLRRFTQAHKAKRLAQRRRELIAEVFQPVMQPGWQLVLPKSLNDSAFLHLPQGRFRILLRTLRQPRGTFAFSLNHRPAPDECGCILLCLNSASQEVNVLVSAGGRGMPYQRFTVDEARTYMEFSVSLRA
ncbi:hypothetical protein [Deinococcus aquatilis]|uniref:hypothetical protein n=1 Tax=Deinococcus aquatilis TaxID=519440 RepID=UPI0003721B0A|nr:hypothetical protein [Deinococcus aquatilis]